MFSATDRAFEVGYFLESSEITRNVLGLIEAAALAALAYYLAERSLRAEVEDGSWRLLRLTPVPVRKVLLGKALGVAGVLLAVHGYAASLLLTYTPFLRRTHAEVWVELLGCYLVALSFVPEGFAYASVRTGDRLAALKFRAGTLLRFGAVVALFQAAGAHEIRALASTSACTVFTATDCVEPPVIVRIAYLVISGRSSAGAILLDPGLPWVATLLWLGATGLAVWHFLVQRPWSR